MDGPSKQTPPLIDKIWAVVTATGAVLGERLTYNAAFLLSKDREHAFVVPQAVADRAKQVKEDSNAVDVPKL